MLDYLMSFINLHPCVSVFRTGWFWGRWMWMFWWRNICTVSRTGRGTSKLSKPKEKRPSGCPGICPCVCMCVIIYTVCLRTCAVFNVCVCVCAQHREGRLHHGELWTRQSGRGRSHPEAVWRSADVPQEIHPGWDQMFNTHCTALMVFTTCTSKSVLLLL